MDTGNPNLFFVAVIGNNVQLSLFDDGEFKLGNLVACGKVGIKIIFPGKFRPFPNFSLDRQTGFDGHLHQFGVEDRQNTGQCGANRTNLGIGLGPEGGGTAAKNFGLRSHLGVDFKADDGFIEGIVCHGFTVPVCVDAMWSRSEKRAPPTEDFLP
ncbi:MAG: hypothetical protein HW380_1165 [Magnetococcales bacterium]|nr:hypothetical protein [Magnetococcales bacterium]